jgi:hypothetical protein
MPPRTPADPLWTARTPHLTKVQADLRFVSIPRPPVELKTLGGNYSCNVILLNGLGGQIQPTKFSRKGRKQATSFSPGGRSFSTPPRLSASRPSRGSNAPASQAMLGPRGLSWRSSLSRWNFPFRITTVPPWKESTFPSLSAMAAERLRVAGIQLSPTVFDENPGSELVGSPWTALNF